MEYGLKQILITGASSGIGLELAKNLCERGYKVWAGARNPDSLNFLHHQYPNLISILKLDVCNESEIQDAFQKIKNELRAKDEFVLINNAGIALGGPLETLSLVEWKKIFDVNVFGLIRMTQVFLPLLRQSQGRVLCIGSISGRIANPFLSPYASSKFAVRAICDSLRREIGRQNIKVVLIEPGPIKTEIWSKSISQSEAQEKSLTSEMQEIYGRSLASLKAGVKHTAENAISTKKAVSIIIEAIQSEKPKPYYLIGRNIKLLAFLEWILPTAFLDNLLKNGYRFAKGKK